tara:strand:+ start:357 stop:788 length:432 start_codon:yes stop_codon:yes gene_type:complete
MKLARILLSEILQYDPEFDKEIEKLKDLGGIHLGSGDYGSAYRLNGKAIKVTTDEVELEHAQILKGKKTNNFVYIYDVKVLNPKLGIIEMEVLVKFKGDIPEEFKQATQAEAQRFGIDPDELDFIGDNVMIHPMSGKLKMIDV